MNSEITKQNKILKQNQEILLTAAKEQDDSLDSIEALNLVKDNLQSFSIKKKKLLEIKRWEESQLIVIM